jgi:ketosteroid isomerase-like protein
MRRYLAGGCICLLALLEACSGGIAVVDTRQADVQAVKDLEAAWEKVATVKDPAKFAGYYSEDALVLSPHVPLISGRDKIQAGLATLMADPNFALTFHAARVEASKGGDFVYTIGAYSRTVSDPKTKAPVTDKGNYLTVWRKLPGGEWKVVTDMDNSELPVEVRQ